MKMTLVTDCLGNYSFEDMLKIVSDLGYEAVEISTGNWSQAPHLNLKELLESSGKRDEFMGKIKQQGLELAVLNCSGNQLEPNEEGQIQQKCVEDTFELASLIGIKNIVMMSGCPGGSSYDKTANWIVSSWPSYTTKILQYQWEEVAIPYWRKMVALAKDKGIEKIALENHGCQLVYNPETMFRLQDAVGTLVGLNYDPSHHMWMGGEPIATIRVLGDMIYHVHAKDVRHENTLCGINNVLDTKTVDQFAERSWNYVALGYGHPLHWWQEFFSVLSMIGYKGYVSQEMEDMTMDSLVGLKKSTNILKQALPNIF